MAEVMPPVLGVRVSFMRFDSAAVEETHAPATKCAHDFAMGAGRVAIDPSLRVGGRTSPVSRDCVNGPDVVFCSDCSC